MVSASLVTDLLVRLEEEKDKWINDAIVRFDGEKYAGKPEELKSPEEWLIEIKATEHFLYNQKNLNLKQMEQELKSLDAALLENNYSLKNLAEELDAFEKELAVYESGTNDLDEIQLEKFHFVLDDQFTFDKKDQVVFKERKTSKLLESFQLVESEMLDFYQRQLSNAWLLLTRSMQNITSSAKFDFETTPPLVDVSLKHGRGLDQYIKPGNFEEDFWIVLETLESNNSVVYDYYLNQIRQFQRNTLEEIKQLYDSKSEHKRAADEKMLDLQEKNLQMENRMAELKEQLSRVKPELEQARLRPKQLEDILKEEFVRTVSLWQERLFAEDASDEERWVYHQYCQIILKQAERIIGNEYF
ncbi:hypothetical protein [Neobacillus niacini]|uniref:hypothetical protein n=1 Tax=Neobacillus niacini TaxID=86668 RepID=UPI003982F404